MHIIEEAVQAVQNGELLKLPGLNNLTQNNPVPDVNYEPIYVYKHKQQGDAVWQWRAPQELPQTPGPVDLTFMLRNIDYTAIQNAPQSLKTQLATLNVALTELRITIGRPGHTDTHSLYIYTHLIHQLSGMFDNSNIKCRAYFDAAPSQNSTSNFTGEYMQALLLLTMRHYNTACEMPDGEQKARLFDRCQAAMEHLCETASLVQSERYDAERRLRRWQYIKAPNSVSPQNMQDKAVRLEEFRRRDTQQLRAFVKQELGGLTQLGAHTLLMQLQKNEMRARDLEAVALDDMAASHALVYQTLGPVLEAVIRDYDAIGGQLQNHTQCDLFLYAASRRLYWFTKQQYVLASVDWAYYRQSSDSDAVGYGLRAHERLKQFEDGDMSPLLQTDVQLLYDTTKTEVSGYSFVKPLPIEPLDPFPTQPLKSHHEFVSEAWDDFVRDCPAVVQALESLKQFHLCCIQEETVMRNTVDQNSPIDPSFDMSNKCMAAVLNDRHSTLMPWLLKRRGEDGTIVLSVEEVALLQLHYEEIETMMRRNKLFIDR
jgi:hypothetical protein